MHQTFKTSLVRNIGLNTVAKVIAIVLSGIANIILARHLVAHDYGIAGFAIIVINLFTQFNDLGISSAVIQKKELTDRAFYTGFTMKIILGVLVFAGSMLVAPLTTYLFHEDAVANVVKLLSLNFLLNSLAFIPITVLTRGLDFKKIMFYQIAISVTGSVTSIVLAVNDFSYWSIVIGNVCATFASVVLINMLKPVRIKLEFDWREAGSYFNFGGQLFLSQLVTFAIINLDNFVVGAVSGADSLGYYALAFNWGSMISVMSATVILNVLFPTFSKIQHDRAVIRNTYLRVVRIIAFISVMANLCLFAASREFLVLVLGHGTDKWLPALPVLKIFCLYGIGRALLEPVGSVIMAIGRTDLMLKSTIVTALIETILLYPALRYFGMTGVAVLVTMSYMIQYFIYFPALRSEIDLPYRDLFRTVSPAIASGLCMGALASLIMQWHGAHEVTTAMFVFKLAACIGGYICLQGILSQWTMLKEAKAILVSMKA